MVTRYRSPVTGAVRKERAVPAQVCSWTFQYLVGIGALPRRLPALTERRHFSVLQGAEL